MKTSATMQADAFIRDEQQFHLGFLPTEQSNPLSKDLENAFKRSTKEGIQVLQRVDREVLAMAVKVLKSDAFATMLDDAEKTVRQGGRIVFSGCGATGRLSILLEAMWRGFFQNGPGAELYGDSVWSIMTGGDYALVKSVEFFEDYAIFGRRQVRDLGMSNKDMLVAITEGGETSSVLGTVAGSLDCGAKVYLLFNNPKNLLRDHLERCRQAIDDHRVTVLDLHCGPMALAGSTRMQATTSEQLIAGAMLEYLVARLLPGSPVLPDFAAEFEQLLDMLESSESLALMADYLDFEAATYAAHGKITYFADDYLLDIFTDTTERSPTFMLPAFRRKDDLLSPVPWAAVRNPLFDTAGAWKHMLHRPPRCLAWTPEDYREMNGDAKIIANPPKISVNDLMMIEIGNECAPERHRNSADRAVLVELKGCPSVSLHAAFDAVAADYPVSRVLSIPAPRATPLDLMSHLAVKLLFNTVSTGTMVKLGRVKDNWMSWVSISNKKLIDRAIRLIAEIGGVDYRSAAIKLFEAAEESAAIAAKGQETPSPVQLALRSLAGK